MVTKNTCIKLLGLSLTPEQVEGVSDLIDELLLDNIEIKTTEGYIEIEDNDDDNEDAEFDYSDLWKEPDFKLTTPNFEITSGDGVIFGQLLIAIQDVKIEVTKDEDKTTL